MEIEKQEMYFVVLGRKKCDFLNFTTLSFTLFVDLFVNLKQEISNLKSVGLKLMETISR